MRAFLNSPLSGYAACFTIIFIWSFWLIVSRIGAASELTIYDLTAMRYGISAIVSLPFVLYFKPWKTLSLIRILSLSFVLGPVYILTVFSGFIYAPAAHGGIFMNGLLPIFSVLIGVIFFAAKFEQKKTQWCSSHIMCRGNFGGKYHRIKPFQKLGGRSLLCYRWSIFCLLRYFSAPMGNKDS